MERAWDLVSRSVSFTLFLDSSKDCSLQIVTFKATIQCVHSHSVMVYVGIYCCCAGLAALGTNNDELFEDMKNVLYTDDAVAGEAAGIGMGLLCCGSGSDKTQEMLAYAHDTQHEKIIRGLAMGLGLISYGIEEAADTLIEQMSREQDPILRYGAMYVLGLAYR